ncbi:hypothetical protein GCM10022223_04630 [Kineosporia mesophila]|uniref:Uncharacterized protein n=1 Tax=Kineosporia mesophila TaxID=566012 RepID=A0ABP6YWF8_9ACTN|nr:hypothetical protein [Kineosporia mesophila]MCD5354324.1 hypothetical protein [Kineosporia mesophila]
MHLVQPVKSGFAGTGRAGRAAGAGSSGDVAGFLVAAVGAGAVSGFFRPSVVAVGTGVGSSVETGSWVVCTAVVAGVGASVVAVVGTAWTGFVSWPTARAVLDTPNTSPPAISTAATSFILRTVFLLVR